jgi:exosortase K
MLKNKTTTALLTIVLTLISIGIAQNIPAISDFFCAPCAYLCKLFTGGQLSLANNGEFLIKNNLLTLRLARSCSAVSFFLLLVGTILYTIKFNNGSILKFFLPSILLSFLITIFLNLSRIICSYKIKIIAPPQTPIPFETLHLAIGVAIFLPALICAHYITDHFFSNAMETNKDEQ